MEKKPNKVKEVKEWLQENKEELCVAACIVATFAVGIGCRYLFGKIPKAKPIVIDDKPVDTVKRILPVFNVGELEDAIRYSDGTIELWTDKIQLSDLGNLGAEITERITDLPENPSVWALMCIREE